MQTTEEEEIAYRMLKNDYFNEGLSDLVRKVDAKKHFLELDGEIVQQKDPVFLNPAVTNSFFDYRTHFFAPLKICFGSKMKTFYFNLMAIVTMTLLLSIALYFESLKKLLTITDKISAIKNKLTPQK
jgi:ABC transport system ATP-binding/permease protein